MVYKNLSTYFNMWKPAQQTTLSTLLRVKQMPPLDQNLATGLTLFELLYGVEKTRKTTWIGLAAKYDFNVVFAQMEKGGCDILISQVPAEFRHRIKVIDIVDEFKAANAQKFMAAFLEGGRFIWDETAKAVITIENAVKNEHSNWLIDTSLMNRNTIFVVDSWTRLARSVQFKYCLDNGIKLSEVEKISPQYLQDYYNASGLTLTWAANQLQGMKCHVFIIGHAVEYDKFKEKTINGRTMREVLWTRTQIISSSGPHAKTLGGAFQDILRFERKSGNDIDIITEGDKDFMGGCRHFAPGRYTWNDIQFEIFLQNGLIAPADPNDQCPAFQYFAPGTLPENRSELNLRPELKKKKVMIASGKVDTLGTQSLQETFKIKL